MRRTRAWQAGRTATFLALYLFAALLPNWQGIFQQAAVWLPTGIAVAGLWVMGPAQWPVIALATLVHRVANHYPWYGCALGVAGNTLEALAAVLILRRFGFQPTFRRVQDAIALVVAALIAPCFSATIGRLAWFVKPDALSFLAGWSGWWRMNALGVLVVVPLALAWIANPPTWPRKRTLAEIVLLGAAVAFVIAVLTPVHGNPYEPGMLLSYLGLPLVLYAAYRYGVRGGATAAAGVALLLTLGTMGTAHHALAPMLDPAASHARALALQGVVLIVTVTPLLLGTALAERETAWRAAERERASREGLVASINRNLNEGLFRSGRDHRVLYANTALARMIGYEDPAELIGHTTDEFAADPNMLEEVRGRLESLGFVADEELFVRHRNGSSVPVFLRCTVVRGANGEIDYVDGSVTDISVRRKLEEQLRQTQKMEALGKLAGGVAHDFNNLLTAIGGYAEILRDDLPEGSAHRRDAQEILGAADRAASLTRQLLAYSRGQKLDPQVLDLREAVAGMGGMLRRLIGEDVQLRTSGSSEPVWVRVDRGQIEQVVLNLALNARDAMPGGGTLALATGTVTLGEPEPGADAPPAGTYVCLSVRDEGVGMDTETRSRAFDPFFTTKGPGKGTGLGLSTVYGIVRQSGGTVSLESEPGRGTTVRVLLPRVAQGPLPAADPPGVALRVPRACTVIVAEDEQRVRDLIVRALLAEGHTVLEAEDGEHALALAGPLGAPPDLLVTDVVMPRLGGRPLAERLTTRWPGLAVLFLSGYAQEEEQPVVPLGSATAFLQKPFTPSALVTQVRACLGDPALGPAAPVGSSQGSTDV